MDNFSLNLKFFRKKSGLTQEQLAELLNISAMTVRRWEWNQRTPRMDDIKKLCSLFNINEHDLLYDHNNNDKWVLEVKIADNKKEVFDLANGMPCIAQILNDQNGALFHVAASYDIFLNDNEFKSLLNQIKKARSLVLQNGKAMGFIK